MRRDGIIAGKGRLRHNARACKPNRESALGTVLASRGKGYDYWGWEVLRSEFGARGERYLQAEKKRHRSPHCSPSIRNSDGGGESGTIQQCGRTVYDLHWAQHMFHIRRGWRGVQRIGSL